MLGSKGNSPTCLGMRDTQEANRHEHTCDCHLIVAELDPIQILHTQTVRRVETVECEDLVHLDSCHERAASLPNDVHYCDASAVYMAD